MGLTMRERQAVTRELTRSYAKATKKQRTAMLDEFVRLTGYSRCYARFMLRNCGRKLVKVLGSERVVFVCGQARPKGAPRLRRGLYGSPAFLEALRHLWALSDGLCGKRLAAFIREIIPHLEHRNQLAAIVDPSLRLHLLSVSAATLDRLLRPTKNDARFKGRSTTRPGSLLKYHVPVRRFSDWNDSSPGFCEIDLVAHDGGAAFGEYCQTLTLTDVATGWTEVQPVKNKAQIHVFAALKTIRARMPFPLLGLDCDNGAEFINHELLRYCQAEQIVFTRSRPYRKNDNCFVEQKNNSVVRRAAGYYRYDRPEQLHLLAEFYRLLRLYVNFFLPVMKLKEKLRTGSRLTRHYDQARTPYHRSIDHPALTQQIKQALTQDYFQLDILALKREINILQAQLFRSALAAPPIPKRWAPAKDHPWREPILPMANFGRLSKPEPISSSTGNSPSKDRGLTSSTKNTKLTTSLTPKQHQLSQNLE